MTKNENSFSSGFDLNDGGETNIFSKLKTELKLRLLKYIIPSTILLVFIIIIIIGLEATSTNEIQSNNYNLFKIGNYFSFYWIFFGFSAFFIIKILSILKNRNTPIINEYIKREINNLNLELKTFYSYDIICLIFLIFSSFFYLFNDLRIFTINEKTLFLGKILLSLVLFSLLNFILWVNNKRIDLKNNYYIYFRIKFPIFKKKEIEMVKIFMKSKRVFLLFNREKKDLFSRISKKRWLQVDKTLIFKRLNLGIFTNFCEFSTFQNFPNKFLNIALATRDWDINKTKLN
ncbi:MAG: hypothetical protein ACQERB_13160 [Promethearchaeati archaeon]